MAEGFNSVALNAYDGRVLKVLQGQEADAGLQAYALLDPLHFGYWGGLPIKILYFLGGLTPAVLSISGFLIWLSRRRKRRNRDR